MPATHSIKAYLIEREAAFAATVKTYETAIVEVEHKLKLLIEDKLRNEGARLGFALSIKQLPDATTAAVEPLPPASLAPVVDFPTPPATPPNGETETPSQP